MVENSVARDGMAQASGKRSAPTFRRGGLELPSRRRRPALAAASAAAVFLGAALGAEAFISAGHRAAVLVTAAPVAHGAQVSRADLKVAEVSASGVAA
ncbi:MAG: hypothetical protein ACYDH5_06650, partial [Acidimicrobiales bacterium]